ncbi:MAG: epoxyqueuosine reductase QueH [Candidatus Adiutrix sp.]|jgi:predicted adenine nucleotide alpha hydrolase (AANH) superfamily ATPase|nr:epoxyqueuosine reductase QueH [Candidatus Adiutrix sp.]
MDRLFLHVCCAPCAAWPLEWFKAERPGLALELWFYNPNIHPRAEFCRRRDSLAYLAAHHQLTADFSPPYEPRAFLAELAQNPAPPERCRLCYAHRLQAAARAAARRGHRYFSTTLTFSRQQKHDLILEEGRRAATAEGLEFYYEDWRPGRRRGQELTRSLGLYRQTYCGCLFSQLEI